MNPLTRFESSVLGAVGRAVGERCPELPGDVGEPLSAVADILEEADGTAFVVQIEDLPEDVQTAWISVETMDGTRIEARHPFGDAFGEYLVLVSLEGDRLAFFVPYGALVDPPSRAMVRLVLRGEEGEARGHTAFALRPIPVDPIEFSTYAQPFADLAWAVAMADGVLSPEEESQIGVQLELVLGGDNTAVAALSKPPPAPPSVSALAVSLRCRFAELDSEELFFALLGIAASDGEVSGAEMRLLQKVASRLDVPERAWHKWAFRMGVDLPDEEEVEASDVRIGDLPPLVVLAERHGQRVPSIILRIDREGQDRRNVFATLSLLGGMAAVIAWLLAVATVLLPVAVAAVLVPIVGGVQLLVSLAAVGLGWLGLRVARDAEGAGQGAATSGLALGVVGLLLGITWWLVVCMGVGVTAYWDQQGN